LASAGIIPSWLTPGLLHSNQPPFPSYNIASARGVSIVHLGKFFNAHPVQNKSGAGFTSLSKHIIMKEKSMEVSMANHIYKKVELVGSSPTSIEDAIQNAISKASKTIHNMGWFEIVETRGQIENNKVAHWQVTIKVGFTVDE
jgi:flavin-binding protein dodecin